MPIDMAQQVQGKKQIIFCPTMIDQARFKDFAARAAELGATHIQVGALPPSRWQQPDRRDPYPHWPMSIAALFKVATPPELAEWIPVDATRRNLEIIVQRCEVLRELGLRATLAGNEPMFLPPEVFLVHPQWRGAECQLLVISQSPYWCPNLDHPEVLDMYRRSMAEVCQAAPEIDAYSFMTNDSGAGVGWSSFIYPGKNGPTDTRTRPMGERIVGFFDALQAGAAEAGCKLEVHMHGGFSLSEIESVVPHLKAGQAFCGKDSEGGPFSAGEGSHHWFSNHVYPLLGLAQPYRFVSGLERAFVSRAPRVSVLMPEEVAEELLDLYEEFRSAPTRGPRDRWEDLRRVAERRVGSDHADELLEVWSHLDRAIHAIRQVRNRGFESILMVGCTTQRWLTRPFVPEPENLTTAEKHYYRRHQFTTKNEEKALNLQDILGRPGIVGQAAVWMGWRALDDTEQELKAGLRLLEDIQGELDGEQAEYAEHLAWRLRMLICLGRNAHNAIMYQHALDNTDTPVYEVAEDDVYTNLGHDRRAILLRRWGRRELDNTAEIIHLLEASPISLLAQAETNEEESVFAFSPDLIHHLRKRIEIMLAHWQEADDMYPSEPSE